MGEPGKRMCGTNEPNVVGNSHRGLDRPSAPEPCGERTGGRRASLPVDKIVPTGSAAGFRLTFHRKLLLAFATVLLPVWLLLCADLLADLRSTEGSILEAQDMTARAVAIQVTESFDAALDFGWAVANDPLVRTLDPGHLDAHLQRLNALTSRINSIGVYDATGLNRGWGEPDAPAEPRLRIGDRPYFQRVMATNAPVISEVLELRRPRGSAMIVSVPVRDPGGRPMGVVNLVLSTHLLEQRYLAARRDSGQDIFLVDPQGRLAFHTGHPSLPFERSGALASLLPLREALAGRPTRVDPFRDPLDDQEQLGAFVPLSRYPWAVGVTVPRERALAPLHEGLRTRLGAFAGILALSGCMVAALARRQTRPVRQLQSFAHALGRGETPRPVHLATGDEMEQLGSAFNQMAADIAGRQAEVEALRARAEHHASQLDAIIASVPDAILLASPEGRLQGANAAGRRTFGLAESPRLELPLAEYLQRYRLRHADGRPLALRELPLHRALSGETFTDVEVLMRTASGEDRLFSVNGAPVKDSTGRIVLGEVVLHDVTERRKVERERLQVLERERALARIGRALVQEVELERIVQVASEQSRHALRVDAVALWLARPEARQLTLVAFPGLSPRIARDHGVMSFEDDAVTARAAREETLQVVEDLGEERTGAPASQTVARSEGFRALVAVPLHAGGRLVGVMTCCLREPRALSPRELEVHTTVGQLLAVALEKGRLFHELRGALRMRDEFMSAAAHELRTPVTTIQTWADLLSRREVDAVRRQKGLSAIARSTRRLARLVEHLFTAVWMAPGPPRLERDRVDLRALVHERVTSLARTTENPIHLEVDATPIIEADRQRMGEVVAHLLENAIRYSPPRGAIEVRLGCAEHEAVVAVRHRGPGIPPERQPHVFEPLYELLPPGTPGYVSVVGLGLHLSWRIIEAHGGRIWLESTPEEGTTFRFSLPLTAPGDAPRARA